MQFTIFTETSLLGKYTRLDLRNLRTVFCLYIRFAVYWFHCFCLSIEKTNWSSWILSKNFNCVLVAFGTQDHKLSQSDQLY